MRIFKILINLVMRFLKNSKGGELQMILQQLEKLAPQLGNIQGLDLDDIIQQVLGGGDLSGAASSLENASQQAKDNDDNDLGDILQDIAQRIAKLS